SPFETGNVQVLTAVTVAVGAEDQAETRQQSATVLGDENGAGVSGRRQRRARRPAGRALEAQHGGMGLVMTRPRTDDVQVAVRPEGQSDRIVQTAAALRDKSSKRGTGGAVIALDAVIAGAGGVQIQFAVSPTTWAEHQAEGEK